MPIDTQLSKWGNSLAVRIRRRLSKRRGWLKAVDCRSIWLAMEALCCDPGIESIPWIDLWPVSGQGIAPDAILPHQANRELFLLRVQVLLDTAYNIGGCAIQFFGTGIFGQVVCRPHHLARFRVHQEYGALAPPDRRGIGRTGRLAYRFSQRWEGFRPALFVLLVRFGLRFLRRGGLQQVRQFVLQRSEERRVGKEC